MASCKFKLLLLMQILALDLTLSLPGWRSKVLIQMQVLFFLNGIKLPNR